MDFVTTEKDLKYGKTRMPLALSRLYDEDLMSDEEVEKAKVEMKKNGMVIESPSSKITVDVNNYNQEDIMVNFEHKQEAYRKSSIHTKVKALHSPMMANTQRGETLYCRERVPEDQEDVSKYVFEDFKILRMIGKGTFGKVYLVTNKQNGSLYAMKSIRKDVVIEHDSLESLSVEKLILLQVKHPFIINMEHVFTKAARIYFVMKFIQGGELFKHLSEQKRFSEHRTKFYAA
jgi:serine/threonine protein kinase